MKTQGAAIQIAVVAGAVLLGVLLDRLVQAASGPSAAKERRAAAAAATASSAAVAANARVDSSASRPDTAESAVPPAASASGGQQSLDSILAQRDARQRLRELQAFINGLTPGEYGDALKRLRQISNSNERELATRLLVTQWAQSDPDGALQFAAGNRGFEYVAEDVFQQLATTNFDSALDRAKGIPGLELRYRALRGVLGFKADTDPRGALQLAATLGDFRGNEPFSSVIYRQWAANDPQAAALQAAEEGQGADWRSPVRPVVETWAQHDPVAAANWSLGIADPQAQSRSLAQVMRRWAREEPQAAANWIYALESGAARDASIAGLAQALVSQDPQTALSWIGNITDDSTRTRTLRRVSGTVMWRDPQNGAALLQAAGLSPEQIRDNRRRRDQ